MGAKKKVQAQQPPPQPPPEKAANIMLKIVTSEGAQFKVNQEIFTKYSQKCKSLAETSKDTTVHLDEIDSETFEEILQFLELHKEKEPAKITVPIRSNQSLKHIMEEPDSELVEKVVAKGDLALLKLMDACLYLELETLRKRLACGVAIKLMGSTVEQLKEIYELEEHNIEEQALRSGMRPIIQELKKTNMEQQN